MLVIRKIKTDPPPPPEKNEGESSVVVIEFVIDGFDSDEESQNVADTVN